METGTIIHGTLRSQDLIPAFMGLLENLIQENEPNPGPTSPQALLARIADDASQDEDADYWYDEQSSWDLEDLVDAIDSLLPEGYYFGTTEGDGADFGIWPIDPMENGA